MLKNLTRLCHCTSSHRPRLSQRSLDKASNIVILNCHVTLQQQPSQCPNSRILRRKTRCTRNSRRQNAVVVRESCFRSSNSLKQLMPHCLQQVLWVKVPEVKKCQLGVARARQESEGYDLSARFSFKATCILFIDESNTLLW